MKDPFRKRGAKIAPLSPEEGIRQGRAARAAQAALGSVDEVRAFLNNRHEGLGGRPLDLAIASDAGLMAVEAEIAAAARGGRPHAEDRQTIGGAHSSVRGQRT